LERLLVAVGRAALTRYGAGFIGSCEGFSANFTQPGNFSVLEEDFKGTRMAADGRSYPPRVESASIEAVAIFCRRACESAIQPTAGGPYIGLGIGNKTASLNQKTGWPNHT
jgi:hypothetical protein